MLAPTGVLDVLVWQCFALGMLCGQARRRSNRSPSNWSICKLHHACTGRLPALTAMLSFNSGTHDLLTCLIWLQIWLAGLMPSVAFLPLTALMGAAAFVNSCKLLGALKSTFGQAVWRSWQDFLGLLGIAMLPQVSLSVTSLVSMTLFSTFGT